MIMKILTWRWTILQTERSKSEKTCTGRQNLRKQISLVMAINQLGWCKTVKGAKMENISFKLKLHPVAIIQEFYP